MFPLLPGTLPILQEAVKVTGSSPKRGADSVFQIVKGAGACILA